MIPVVVCLGDLVVFDLSEEVGGASRLVFGVIVNMVGSKVFVFWGDIGFSPSIDRSELRNRNKLLTYSSYP